MPRFVPYFIKRFHVYTLVLFLCFGQHTYAQKTGAINNDHVFARYASSTAVNYDSIRAYYVIKWNDGLPETIRVVRKLTDEYAIVKVTTPTELNWLVYHSKIAVANNEWKLSPSLEKLVKDKNETGSKYIITGESLDSLLLALKPHTKEVTIVTINKPARSVIIKCTAQYLKEYLLELKEVIFVDMVQVAHVETNIIGYDRSYHGINAVDYLVDGANGRNIVAGVKEQKIEENDLDVWKRVLPSPIAAATTSHHATVIASIIGGAGNSSYEGRGIAWGARFFPSSFANLFADEEVVLKGNKVSVQNHSYGTIVQPFYGAEAMSYDALTWNDKTFVPVFSAGNQGETAATEGRYANLPGYGNLTGNFKNAKNIITVGAIDNKGNIPVQTSAGPLYDGRIAPQLIALGPNGTSDAAAIVTGTVAVLQQVYADSNGQIMPPASLVKSLMYNTADDIYHSGLDYKTGYGLLNSFEAVRSLQKKNFDGGSLSQGQQWSKTILIPANAAQLKVTLAWTDTSAPVNNLTALTNDLDLELREVNTNNYYQPWGLNTTANIDSLAKLPVRKRDFLNTAELVSIKLPGAGTYEVTVKGTSVQTLSLPFNIAYNVDTLNTFRFTNPLHASDVNRQENEIVTIRWRTFVADTNQTGNLYISYNEGTTWHVLEHAFKLHSGKYQWPIKDTSSVALLKMETAFGVFLSNKFLISPITKVSVDFNCADSFRLSWNKHVYGNAYKVYQLTDSSYLKHVFTVTDTFAVLQRSQFNPQVYAVEPILNNGLTAARSVALNIDLQGVQCFYKALNYNLLDQNKLNLLLELSIADYVDSVYFESVSAAGQLVRTYGGSKANTGKLIYSQLVDEVTAGVTHVRGRIKLKNGSIVYTDIIPVLTSGKEIIRFYPNPVRRNVHLKYVVQQGISNDLRLQLFTVSGQLIESFSSLPDEIDISRFAAGVIVFKLINSDNKTLQTGKLVIQQ